MSHRVRGAIVAPSAAAVECVLWLAAIDRSLRVEPRDAAAVQQAYAPLRRLIRRHAPTLYREAPVDDDRELVWIGRVRESIADGAPGERAAVLVWAAALAWTDAPAGRWGELADAAERLALALADGRSATELGRVATELRAVAAGLWTMEGER